MEKNENEYYSSKEIDLNYNYEILKEDYPKYDLSFSAVIIGKSSTNKNR